MICGRKEELATLEARYAKGTFELVIMYGRRRVGKTTIIREFAQGKRTLFFTALEQSDEGNLADISLRIADFFGLPSWSLSFDSWSHVFEFLAERSRTERFVFAFDEFPYAAMRNESLPSALQIAIDHQLKDTNLFMILCGSNQGFMESEVLGRKSPLFGRRTLKMKVEPLSYLEAREMLPGLNAQDSFRFYGCFGGVPYYLERVDQDLSLRENLEELYFSRGGFLFDEPMDLLRQETREPAVYASVLRAVACGANRPSGVADKVGMAMNSVSKYLLLLRDMGLIERVVPFGENPSTSKKGIYRLRDACFEFWFRFVMPQISDIESGLGPAIARRMPEQLLDEYLGHRFERLCADWFAIRAAKGLLPIPATSTGSWWGTNPAKRAQDDIDVIAADTFGKQAVIGECKYREKFDVGSEVEDLLGKAELVKGYETAGFYIFSKHRIERADKRVRFVCLEDMYSGE